MIADRLRRSARVTALAATLALSTGSCEPRVPPGQCGIEIVVRSGDPDVSPDVVYVRLDPPGSPLDWAIDIHGHLPAGRTIWVGESGDRIIRAAGFECPAGGCGSVDPATDAPIASGSALVSLEPGHTTRIAIDLAGRVCGNALVEPGEACDGADGCGPDCAMPVADLEIVPGRPDDGIAVLASGSGFAIAWIDGSCGGGEASCLSWIQFDDAGSRTSTTRSLAMGDTTGRLATDRRRYVAWVTSDPSAGTGSVAAFDIGGSEGAIDLGRTVPDRMPGTAVSGPHVSGASAGPFAMAIEPETGTLELRWPGGGSTRAVASPAGVHVERPGIAIRAQGDSLGVSSLWSLESAVGEPLGWFERHWSFGCATPPIYCIPYPEDTDAIPTGLEEPDDPGFLLLPGPAGGEQILVSARGDDLEVRVSPYPDRPAADPDVLAAGALTGGFTMVNADFGVENGIVAMLALPDESLQACESRLLLLPLDHGMPALLAVRDAAAVGCSGSLALLGEHRVVAAWRGQGEVPGTVEIRWSIAAIGAWR